MIRKYLLVIIAILGLFSTKIYSQATTLLYIDSVSILNPVVFGGTVDLAVQVRISAPVFGDTLTGDIYYYYQTDTMDSLGIPPIAIEQDSVSEFLSDPFLDTIQIPIDNIHMKTGPLNLIVVWPAMIHPAVLDTDSIVFELPVEGYLGLDPPDEVKGNILYPLPAIHYLFIKPDEIGEIQELFIMNLQGQIVDSYQPHHLQNGYINIDHLSPGYYLAILQYKNGQRFNKKILKE